MGLILPSLADVIIAGVHPSDAGAASGLVNTGLQVGNAIGVAIVGVILFSVLGAHAGNSAQLATPHISTQLAALGVPADERQQTVHDFQRCFIDKAQQEDPAATPTSCRDQTARPTATQDQGLRQALTTATIQARKDNFAAAIQRALQYEVAVFIAAFALLFLLPRTTGFHSAVP
jgi:ABC-type multidrug transport system fused ATPase/permease subunit